MRIVGGVSFPRLLSVSFMHPNHRKSRCIPQRAGWYANQRTSPPLCSYGKKATRDDRRQQVAHCFPSPPHTLYGLGSLTQICAKACSRSAIRSSASSKPTDSRIRLAGTSSVVPATEAWVMAPGWHMPETGRDTSEDVLSMSFRLVGRKSCP